MKERSLFPLMLSLTILATGLLGKLPSTTAAPAPIFRPILRDIQNQLPRNLVFRLPGNFPAKVARYGRPKLEFQANRSRASLRITYIGCERDFPPGGRGYAINCIPFTASSSSASSKHYQEFIEQFDENSGFELRRNVRARHVPGDGWNQIEWIQDGVLFHIYSGVLNLSELTQVARSMANELPIRRSISR